MNETVLLLEDDPDHAWLSTRTIMKGRSSFQIIHFDNGEDLLDFVDMELNRMPGIIFLDMHLPGISGMNVLRKLKRDKRFDHTPIVMLTTSRSERDILESYSLGASSYIVKPLDEKKFKDVMVNLFSIETMQGESK